MFRTLKASEIDLIVYDNGDVFTKEGKKLKVFDSKGYKYVCVGKGKNRKKHLVHRLVAQAFIPNEELKPCVNHKDGNKGNNNVSNLEWCTYSENELHSHRVLGKKTSLNNIKKMVQKHKEMYSKKVSQKSINGEFVNIYESLSNASKLTGISEGNISMCCNNQRKTAGGYIWNFVL